MRINQKEASHQTEKTEEDQIPEIGVDQQEDLEMGTETDPHLDPEIRGQGKVKEHQMTKPPPKRQTPPESTKRSSPEIPPT